MIIQGFDTKLLHIFSKTALKVATIVPGTYGAFCKDEFFIRVLIMNIVQFIGISTIVMVGSPCNVLRGFSIFIDMQRVLLLRRHIIIVVVMVEKVDFNLSKAFIAQGFS